MPMLPWESAEDHIRETRLGPTRSLPLQVAIVYPHAPRVRHIEFCEASALMLGS
jgi:hypothetical protein